MRPVNRPADPDPNGLGEWPKYAHAQPYLIRVLGEYCSYCERRILTGAAVEHIIPKALSPWLETQWTNYLLACVNCNSSKNDVYRVQLWYDQARWAETVPGTFCLFPHQQGATVDMYVPNDGNPAGPAAWRTKPLRRTGNYKQDTFNSFLYKETGEVEVNPNVPAGLAKDRAALTLALVRLDRVATDDDQELKDTWKVKWQDKISKSLGNHFKRSKSASTVILSRGLVTPSVAGDAQDLLDQVSTLKAAPIQVVSAVGAANTLSRIQAKEEGSADYRLIQRREQFQLAERYRAKFDRLLGDYRTKATVLAGGGATKQYSMTPQSFQERLNILRKLTIDQAKAVGYWSVWVTVFQRRPMDARFNRVRPAIVPVLNDLLDVNHFPGTRAFGDFAPPIYTQGALVVGSDEQIWNTMIHAGAMAAGNQFQATVIAPIVDPVQNNLIQARADLKQCQEDAVDLGKQKDALSQELTTSKKALADKEEELRKCRTVNEGLRDENKRISKLLSDERAQAQQSLAQMQQERDQAQQRLAQMQQERDQAQHSLAQTQQERDQAQQRLAQMQQERDQAQQQMVQAQMNLIQVHHQLALAQGQMPQQQGQDDGPDQKKRKLGDE